MWLLELLAHLVRGCQGITNTMDIYTQADKDTPLSQISAKHFRFYSLGVKVEISLVMFDRMVYVDVLLCSIDRRYGLILTHGLFLIGYLLVFCILRKLFVSVYFLIVFE